MENKNQLNPNLKLSLKISIHAKIERVWEILTSPVYIKEYLYGTDAVSEWKEGSPLVFSGIWEGTVYEDRGMIRVWQPPQNFTYTYFSNFFGLPDLPENYALLENQLLQNGEFAELQLTQTGFVGMDQLKHSEVSWTNCLNALKEIAERR